MLRALTCHDSVAIIHVLGTLSLSRSLADSLTPSLSHSFAHSLNCSLTRSRTYSLAHLLARSLTHSLTNSLTRSLARAVACRADIVRGRRYSAIARTDCVLAELLPEQVALALMSARVRLQARAATQVLQTPVGERSPLETAWLVDMLSKVPFLEQFNAAHVAALASAVAYEKHAKGDAGVWEGCGARSRRAALPNVCVAVVTVVQQGEPGSTFYIVLSGTYKVFKHADGSSVRCLPHTVGTHDMSTFGEEVRPVTRPRVAPLRRLWHRLCCRTPRPSGSPFCIVAQRFRDPVHHSLPHSRPPRPVSHSLSPSRISLSVSACRC